MVTRKPISCRLIVAADILATASRYEPTARYRHTSLLVDGTCTCEEDRSMKTILYHKYTIYIVQRIERSFLVWTYFNQTMAIGNGRVPFHRE